MVRVEGSIRHKENERVNIESKIDKENEIEKYGSEIEIEKEIEVEKMKIKKEIETEKYNRKIENENEMLFEDIIELCECKLTEDTKHVILLIGVAGAGKSSLINTMHKILTGRYFLIAKQGRGVSQSCTGELIRYDNLGILPETIRDVDRQRKIRRIFKQLPQIVDFAGLGNIDTPAMSEVLELLIGGHLPARTTITALEHYQMRFGVGAAKRIFSSAEPEFVVSKIIFLHGCTEEIPVNLIDCLKRVLNTVDKAKGQFKYKPDIFLLTSKFDLAGNSSIHPVHSENKISLEDFEKVEKRLADKFNIAGRSHRWISITDSVRKDNVYIDNLGLKFLKALLEPGVPAQKDGGVILGRKKKVELLTFELWNLMKLWLIRLNFTPANVLAFLSAVFFILIAVWYMTF